MSMGPPGSMTCSLSRGQTGSLLFISPHLGGKPQSDGGAGTEIVPMSLFSYLTFETSS